MCAASLHCYYGSALLTVFNIITTHVVVRASVGAGGDTHLVFKFHFYFTPRAMTRTAISQKDKRVKGRNLKNLKKQELIGKKVGVKHRTP